MAHTNYGLILLEAQGAAGWSISLLFLLFLVIGISWEITLGVLTWAASKCSGSAQGAELLLERLTEELLSLGVLSLVLAFVKTSLTHICIAQTEAHQATSANQVEKFNTLAGRRFLLQSILEPKPGSSGSEYGSGDSVMNEEAITCPDGKVQVFPKNVITAGHFMLFYLAVVSILYSLLVMSFTSHRLRRLLGWEREVRTRAEGKPRVSMGHTILRSITGNMDQHAYKSLRALLQLRALAHGLQHRFQFVNLATAAEQAIQYELSCVAGHAWVQTLVLAVLLLYPLVAYQIIWAAGLALLIALVLQFEMGRIIRKASRLLKEYEHEALVEAQPAVEPEAKNGHPGPIQGQELALVEEHGLSPSGQLSLMGEGQVNDSQAHKLGRLERDVQSLFWFHWPRLLLWAISFCQTLNALSITVSVYFLLTVAPQRGRHAIKIWLPLLILDLFTAVVLGYIVVPQYALLCTALGMKPHRLTDILLSASRAGEEDKSEDKGIKGLVVRGLKSLDPLERRRRHLQKNIKAHDDGSMLVAGRAETDGAPAGPMEHTGGVPGPSKSQEMVTGNHEAVASSLVQLLVLRAGVFLPAGTTVHSSYAQLHSSLLPCNRLVESLVSLWAQKADAHTRDAELGGPAGYQLGTELSQELAVLRAAYNELDLDQSGSLAGNEIELYAKEVLGVRLSPSEVVAVMAEAGAGSAFSAVLDFRGFVLLVVFTTLDAQVTGQLTSAGLSQVLPEVIGTKEAHPTPATVAAMVAFAAPKGVDRVGLEQFVSMYNDIQL